MPDCFGILTNNFTFDCDNKPVAGLEVNVTLINRADINYTTTAYTGSLITNLALNTGLKKGVRLEGIKQINAFLSELVTADDSYNKFKHTFSGRIHNLTAAVRADIDKMANSDRGFVIVVEKIWKGATNASAYVVLGLKNGLFMTEGTENSNEADGTFNFVLSSREISLEPDSPKNLLMTDYATTLTASNNGFISGA
jgi:hypothetical protein